MSSKFCGNASNHKPHDWVEEYKYGRSDKTWHCDGVDRPEVKQEEKVERWMPNENDGKVQHKIEEAKDSVEKDAHSMILDRQRSLDMERKGYESGRDLMVLRADDTDVDYLRGYERAIKEMVEANHISPNRGRELLGLPAYDPVKIPAHYNRGKIEVANFIADQELPYPMDNIVKYVCRAGHKEGVEGLQDLEKAAAYLQMAYNIANGLPAVVRDRETDEVVWTLFKN